MTLLASTSYDINTYLLVTCALRERNESGNAAVKKVAFIGLLYFVADRKSRSNRLLFGIFIHWFIYGWVGRITCRLYVLVHT